MRILMLVNWKVCYCNTEPGDMQPPDYFLAGTPYWFFRYFGTPVEVDVADIHTFPWLEHFEKEKLHFYIVQTLKILPRLKQYDIILSHGMQSAVVLSLFRRLFHTRAKHIVFDIGAFNSAAESGVTLKLMQFASKSIDGCIYHTSGQIDYYRKYFPWIVPKSRFIRFGTDAKFFIEERMSAEDRHEQADKEVYILCVGYAKRDWNTLYQAFLLLQDKEKHGRNFNNNGVKIKLKLIGCPQLFPENEGVKGVPFLPVRQLMKEIESALFCVLPLENFNYSFGQMTLLQQMALGKAVITAEVPSMTDYVEDGTDALLYKPGDINSLFEKMRQLLEDEGFRDEIGKNAAHSIHNKWNEQQMAKEVERYLFDIFQEKV